MLSAWHVMNALMTHTKPCKFCGIPVTVESDPDCPPEWAESLLNMLSCNRCADYRAAMGRIGAAIRKVCLNYIQLVNGKTITDDGRNKVRKGLEALTWKVADATCKFYRTRATIYSQDFVDQIMEHPDKSALILKTYAGMVRDEARKQRQQHEQRIEPANPAEAILCGSGDQSKPKAGHFLLPDGERPHAMASPEANQSAGGSGQDQRGSVSQETLLI